MGSKCVLYVYDVPDENSPVKALSFAETVVRLAAASEDTKDMKCPVYAFVRIGESTFTSIALFDESASFTDFSSAVDFQDTIDISVFDGFPVVKTTDITIEDVECALGKMLGARTNLGSMMSFIAALTRSAMDVEIYGVRNVAENILANANGGSASNKQTSQ